MASRATVKVDDAALLALIRRTSGPSAIQRVEKTLREAAEELAEFARNDFPVSRWESGKIKGKKHARDTIRVEGRVTPSQIAYSVVSDSAYIYYIRSRQIGEDDADQVDRFARRDGEGHEDYDARRTVGRKQHAWTVLVTRPGKRISKDIAQQIGDDLLKLAQGR
jgi:hypothetical protein